MKFPFQRFGVLHIIRRNRLKNLLLLEQNGCSTDWHYVKHNNIRIFRVGDKMCRTFSFSSVVYIKRYRFAVALRPLPFLNILGKIVLHSYTQLRYITHIILKICFEKWVELH